MSTTRRTETLIDELDQQELGVPVDDETASVPTLSCESDAHNGEPIREGEHAVLLLARGDEGWEVEHTFCSHCSVGDEYSELDDERATAVVEGMVAPDNEFGPSKRAYLLDGFLWELYEAENER